MQNITQERLLLTLCIALADVLFGETARALRRAYRQISVRFRIKQNWRMDNIDGSVAVFAWLKPNWAAI